MSLIQQQRPTDDASLGGSDDAILAAIQDRDDAALATLYDRYGRLAFGLAYRILGEHGSAEDVVQETFLNVWRRAGSFQAGHGSARPWLMSIVHNLAIDRRRGRLKREWTDVALDDVSATIEIDEEETFASVAGAIEAEQVQRAVRELPLEQRQAIELAYFGGLTHQEIAEQTGAPLGTVKSRMRLGLQKLRLLLTEAGLESHPAADG